MQPHRTARRAGGFTLVELLIALAMIGLITLLLFSGLRLGGRAWDAVERVSGQTDEVRLAHGFLARVLSQARITTVIVDAEMLTVFGGDAQRLEFAAPLSEQVGVSGLYVLRLMLARKGDGQALILSRWLLHPEILEGGDGVPIWEPLEKNGKARDDYQADVDLAGGAFGRTLLLENVSVFDIAYYGTLDGESDPDWHPEWFEQSAPPTHLRIRLMTVSQAWPDLIVTLPAQPF